MDGRNVIVDHLSVVLLLVLTVDPFDAYAGSMRISPTSSCSPHQHAWINWR